MDYVSIFPTSQQYRRTRDVDFDLPSSTPSLADELSLDNSKHQTKTKALIAKNLILIQKMKMNLEDTHLPLEQTIYSWPSLGPSPEKSLTMR